MEALSEPSSRVADPQYALLDMTAQHGRTRSMTSTLIAPHRGTKLV